ncbi:MAG TPA: FAD-dependent oxidoreductase [Solirubrobacteraceae bacterium]|jgi:NADPH-dependent 2,4-dienoyl-CoA reductase/sulfur reductase-like enzyme|nr:FAD-dependent oxidoreductase [Solirubrobacteraceae bacterium]
MTPQRVVIIGGGPAGLATARGYRDAGGEGSVTLVAAEPHLPYQRPPLTKEFLRGELDRTELELEEASWFAERSVELRLGTPARAIDREGGKVRLADGQSVSADACVLATGARPRRLPVPGADHEDVFEMRVLADSERLIERAQSAASAVVIGSGFIGCEAAASLAMRGLEVTLVTVEAVPQAQRLGPDAGDRIAGWLRQGGVTLILDAEVEEIINARRVRLADGACLDADVVLMASGVVPNGELAQSMGLELHDGAVPVDASMRSERPFLSAAGDVAWARNRTAGRRLRVEHWGDALAQGEVAGRALAGEEAEWDEVPGFWSTIGSHTLKYAAWGDGFDEDRLIDHGQGAFTVWYARAGVAVGVLTHERDEDYERGRELIARGEQL